MEGGEGHVVDSCCNRFTEDVLGFREKGTVTVVLLEDFNARVGRSVDVDAVVGMFGKTHVMLMGIY